MRKLNKDFFYIEETSLIYGNQDHICIDFYATTSNIDDYFSITIPTANDRLKVVRVSILEPRYIDCESNGSFEIPDTTTSYFTKEELSMFISKIENLGWDNICREIKEEYNKEFFDEYNKKSIILPSRMPDYKLLKTLD